MLPEGWQKTTVGACARFVSGGTPSKQEPSYWDGQLPWITAFDMKSMTLIDSRYRLTEAGRSVASVVPANTVLILTRGMTLLKDLPVGLTSREVAFNQDIKALIPAQGVDAAFLAYQLSGRKEGILDLVDTAGHGTGRLDTALLKDFVIFLPPLKEQEDISVALQVWDAAIAASNRMLANSRTQRRALLSRLLRMPFPTLDVGDRVRSGNLPPSVQPGVPRLPATPVGWERKTFGHHLVETSRPVVLSPEVEYELVTVKRSRGGVTSRGRLRGADIKTSSQSLVRAGDFLISKRQIVHGACGLVPESLDGAVVSNEYVGFTSDGGLDLKFLCCLSETIYFQQACFHSSIGVHVEKMIFNTERWLKFPINLPPLEEQRRIVRKVDDASREIALRTAALEKLKLEKAGLMQELLIGKRRLRKPESVST